MIPKTTRYNVINKAFVVSSKENLKYIFVLPNPFIPNNMFEGSKSGTYITRAINKISFCN